MDGLTPKAEHKNDTAMEAAAHTLGPAGIPMAAVECATVTEGTLSDGSTVHDVMVDLCGERITLHAANESSARRMAESLNGFSLAGITMPERDSLKALNAELLAALEKLTNECAGSPPTMARNEKPRAPSWLTLDDGRALIAKARRS